MFMDRSVTKDFMFAPSRDVTKVMPQLIAAINNLDYQVLIRRLLQLKAHRAFCPCRLIAIHRQSMKIFHK